VFESAEIGRRVRKAEYEARAPALRQELLRAQDDLQGQDFPALVLFAGVDGAGKSETVNLLNAWMDPRWIQTHAFDEPSDEERERPELWRYWRQLPPNGQIGLLLSAWYSPPLLRRVQGGTLAELDASLDEITLLEKTLADDGALVLKFWMHLGKKQQKKRLRALSKDPLQAWRVHKRDWKHWRMYGDFVAAAERIISRTSTAEAPWHIIEGADPRYRSLRVGEILRDGIRRRLAERAAAARVEAPQAPAPPPAADPVTVLSTLEMDRRLPKEEYGPLRKKLQGELHQLQRRARSKGISTVLVFEGWDAGGKGGAIRRIAHALDARSFRVHPIAAPTDEERAHHYLWRFWRQLPRAGRVALFDRSWYGRVLVERVEGFASESEWRRAYAEINWFERRLVEHGIVLLKFWLHITPDEQQRRFEQRQVTPYKRWKLTAEDWRNRAKWDLYERAVHDMVERTSTQLAPWTLVEGNDKRFARIKVLRTLCDKLGGAVS